MATHDKMEETRWVAATHFETSALHGAAHALTAPVRAVDHAANPASSKTGELQGQVNRWIVLALAAAASFMTMLDGSIVNIGLPSIARTFHVGISGATEWIIIGYLVVIAAVLLTCGHLADVIGRKPIFLTGLVVFILGSALCGLAPSLLLLILARLFQGIGGALISSVNVAMLTSAFPSRERGLALGFHTVAMSLGVAAGPTLGGIITQYLTWRYDRRMQRLILTYLVVLPQRAWMRQWAATGHIYFECGGVGPLTNVILLKHCVQAACQLASEKKNVKIAA